MNVNVSAVNPGYEEEDGASYPRNSYSNDTDLHHRRSNWAKEETPRDAAILIQELPSKQFGDLNLDICSN